MEIEELEKRIRILISLNKIEETILLLNDYFADDSDLDSITLQSAKYNAILQKQINGAVKPDELELALSKLRANILQLLRSKKEYLKYKKLTFEDAYDSEIETEEIKVFFSVGSPHNDKQQVYIKKIVDYFKSHGIILETLKKWNDNDPILPIIDELESSYGCFVLALERYFINEGVEKRGSEQENLIKEKSFTSPWLHIEAAIARSLDLPLIIFKDKSLNNEGLIHDDKQEWGIVRISENEMEKIFEYPIKNFILSWIQQVKKYKKEKK